jgi:D-alanine-D-alanine ligase
MDPLTVGLCYDLREDHVAAGLSPEEAAELDCEETIAAIEGAVRAMGLRTVRIGHGRALCQRLVAGERWDLVFNIAEGLRGRSREAQVPAILELYEIPYTFSDPLTCAATLDKAVAKILVRGAGLNTPDFAVIRSIADLAQLELPMPVFAKPLQEGTGIGIGPSSRIDDPCLLGARVTELLQRHRQPVLVERFLPGREFTTGVVGTGADARVVGTMELSVDASAGDYGYAAKQDWQRLVAYRVPEPGPLVEAVERLALDAYRALECRDGSRVDLRLDHDGVPAFIEVNPLPGLNPVYSDLPMLARMHGVGFEELIAAIVRSAMARCPVRHVAA